MTYDPQKHHRRSIRLKGYDYSQPGAYFVTMCTQNRKMLFGDVVGGEMNLNDYGKLVELEWFKTEKMRTNIRLDAFVVMPNHLHGIIVIDDCWGTEHRAPTVLHSPTIEQFGKSTSNSIPTIIRGFKSAVTTQINAMRHSPGTKLWQRNYYEHIIRTERELQRIQQYIVENPLKWENDKYFQ
ncbi:MAG: transposase [Candidatus Marinimicrobia bacterium]|nr:transposase [Candidatus Neomarinimicrobiota bacterium]